MSEGAARPPSSDSSSARRGGRGDGRGSGNRRRGRGGRGSGKQEDGSGKQQQQQQQQQQISNKKVVDGVQSSLLSKKAGSRSRRHKKSAPPPLTEEEKHTLEEHKRKAAEKAAAEDEQKRQEDLQKAMDAARENRRVEEAQLVGRVNEACDALTQLLEATEHHKECRASMAAESLVKFRRDFEKSKKSLKSDFKKCTAFVKKVKSGSAWSMKPSEIAKDVASLNLSRYVDEVADALLEAKTKVGDMPAVLALCAAMHLRYAEFLQRLTPALWKAIQEKKTDTKIRRLYVRLVTEFLLNGLLVEAKPMVKLITEATGGKDGSYNVSDANVVVSFARAAGFEILSTKPRSVRQHIELIQQETDRALAVSKVLHPDEEHEIGDQVSSAEEGVPKNDDEPIVISKELVEKALQLVTQTKAFLLERALPPHPSETLKTHCFGAYVALSKSLVVTHAKAQKLEKRCEQDRLLAGALSEAREKGLTDARKFLDNLHKSVEVLADVLDQPIPELEEEEEEDVAGSGVGLELWTKEGGDPGSFGPFDDEETRDFYCDIPDLLTTVPPKVLGMSQADIEILQDRNGQKYGTGIDAIETDAETEANLVITPASVGDLEAAEALEGNMDATKGNANDNAGEEEEENSPQYALKNLLEDELPECCRREQVDELTEKFCVKHGTSKNARKRLANTLFLVPRTRLDLLPYYSRLTAILDRVFPDVSASLVKELEQQFHGQAKFKKNQNVESRLRTARFLGELTKFRVAPPIVALRSLSRCLEDFNGFNIDVACCILESCGRYLYRTKHTETRLSTLLETMMRLSKTKHLDERALALIKSAFCMVKPPPIAPRKQVKVYPPMEAYLRHLLMMRLDPTDSSVSFVTKQLLRLPWNDPSKQCGALVCNIMLKTCRRGRYKAIGATAAVVANMRRSKPEVSTRIIDAVLEELQWAIEYPTFREQQRTLTYAKLLGELYRASVVTSHIIIHQLHHFINFGHKISETLKAASEKQLVGLDNESVGTSDADSKVEGQLLASTGGITQTILEDEEMDDEELVTSDTRQPEKPQVVAASRHSQFDPRVPSDIDPLTSVFRVKLVCTLLDASIPSIVTRNNLLKLDGFLAAFQRYLFTKTTLPSEVEFAILDVFDLLDSQWKAIVVKDAKNNKKATGTSTVADCFKRYPLWIDAHNATIANEEADFLYDSRATARLEALVAEAAIDGADGIEMAEGDDIESRLQIMDEDESVDDALSMSAKDSIVEYSDSDIDSDDDEHADGSDSEEDSNSDAGSDEESDGSNDSDEDSDDGDISEEEEEEFDEEEYQRHLEEELFERELRKMQKESFEKGKAVSRKQVSDVMISGAQFLRKKNPVVKATATDSKRPLIGEEGIQFQFLRRGNKGKVDTKEIVIPDDTNLAKVVTKQDEQAAKEMDLVKARVLQYEAESTEQQMSGGNLYLEQEKLQQIRNRPLSMDDIDNNFGTRGGDLRGQGSSGNRARQHQPPEGRGGLHQASGGRGQPDSSDRSRPHHTSGGGGRGGRGTGRGRSGRSLYF